MMMMMMNMIAATLAAVAVGALARRACDLLVAWRLGYAAGRADAEEWFT